MNSSAMNSVADVDRLLTARAVTLPPEQCALAAAVGRVLREPVLADRDTTVVAAKPADQPANA